MYESEEEFLRGEGGFAGTGYLGIGVFPHLEDLPHHLGDIVEGGSSDQSQLLLVNCKVHSLRAQVRHVVFCG